MILRTLGVAALLLFSASACDQRGGGKEGGGNAAQDNYERGYDRPGEDIGKIVLQKEDPAQCAKECQANTQCRSWTMVKAGVQDPQALCFLKGKAPLPVPNDCCTSGAIPGRAEASAPAAAPAAAAAAGSEQDR